MKKMRTAIIGQGRSGRNIHGRFFKSENNTIVEVVAVVELDSARRDLALKEYPGCVVYSDYHELFVHNDIDLVVNSTYSDTHYSITKDLLEHGFNVLVEKPFARNYFECCDLINIANKNNVTLAVFHQSLLAPHHLGTKAMIESGKLGDIKQISIHYNGFARRWDWQTLQMKMGGNVYNTGPHPIGMALDYLDFDKDAKVVFSKLDTAMTSGDAEDFAKIIISAPGKPIIDIEISSIDAFSDFNIKVQGSKGTYSCTTSKYKMKYIADGENPDRPVIVESLKDESGNPIYCSEKLITHEEDGVFNGSAFVEAVHDFYLMLSEKIFNGKPMEIKNENIAKIISIIETVHAENPLPVKY